MPEDGLLGVRIHCRVPDAVAQRLTAAADAEGVKPSVMMRRAIVAYLPDPVRPVPPRPSPVTSPSNLSFPALRELDRPLGERLAEIGDAFAKLAADLRGALRTEDLT